MKDPAVLFFISDWLTSTGEMDSDCRGWYLNLILHNYDKGSLPKCIEKLAVLAGVKFSEFERFKQVFEQVLNKKFQIIDGERISNEKTQTILRSRETFKDKRSEAGKKSYLMKYFAKNFTKEYKTKAIYNFVNERIDVNIDTKDEQVIKQVFKQMFELYRIENENETKYKSETVIEKNELEIAFENFKEMRKASQKHLTKRAEEMIKTRLKELSGNDMDLAVKILNQSTMNNWASIYELKKEYNGKTVQETQENKIKNAAFSAIQNVFNK